MATIETEYLGELRCSSIHVSSGGTLTTDAPVDNCGKGSTFSPTDLLATALINCMITVMGIHANENNIELVGLTGSAIKKMGIGPRRVAGINVEIKMSGKNLTSEMRGNLEQVALNCPVANSLSAELRQAVSFDYDE